MPGLLGQMGMATVIGFFSGLVGAGGAFLSVPFLSKRVPIHAAVATSAAIGFPIALTNMVGYVISGWGLPTMPGAVGFLKKKGEKKEKRKRKEIGGQATASRNPSLE